MRLLIAEDGMMMRRVLCRTLKEWEYEVVEAVDGTDAWNKFQQQPFQLVLTDWIMPELDGLELIRLIRAASLPGYVYIILLTAKSETEDLVIGMEAGADDFLVKPVDLKELRVRLRAGERIIRLEHALAEQNRQLRETQAALVQSEKLASLGQMAAGMAHEINNPIALVANNLAVLKRDVAEVLKMLDLYLSTSQDVQLASSDAAKRAVALADACDYKWFREEAPQLFDKSLVGLQRVRDIVQKLRDFARLDEAELDELDVNDAIDSVADMLHHELATRQLELRIEHGSIPLIECEPARIQQVIHHLLLNAIQASAPEGRVAIRTSSTADQITLEVVDHGCGIAAIDLPHVFEPFFTTRPVGSGQGLGLAVSYGIVRDHGGSISVTSEVGVGSTFRVNLPLRPPKNS